MDNKYSTQQAERKLQRFEENLSTLKKEEKNPNIHNTEKFINLTIRQLLKKSIIIYYLK